MALTPQGRVNGRRHLRAAGRCELRVEATITPAAAAGGLRERQLKALVRLLRRAAALQAEAKRAA